MSRVALWSLNLFVSYYYCEQFWAARDVGIVLLFRVTRILECVILHQKFLSKLFMIGKRGMFVCGEMMVVKGEDSYEERLCS